MDSIITCTPKTIPPQIADSQTAKALSALSSDHKKSAQPKCRHKGQADIPGGRTTAKERTGEY